jgi:hypothetical protein
MRVLLTVLVLVTTSRVGSTAKTPQGLTLKTYTNMALAGPPATTTVVGTASCSLPGGSPFSAELVGTLAFPPGGGMFHFECTWTNTTVGFVWVDGHMVCQDGHAYRPDAGKIDNPLPVNLFNRTKGVVASLPFRAHVYSGGGTADTAVGVHVTWTTLSAVEHEALIGRAAAEAAGAAGERAVEASAAAERMLAALPHAALPAAALAPDLPAAEQQRDTLQRGLATGWGSWLHENMLPLVKLPEAAVLTPAICSKVTGECVDSCIPDGARPFPTSKPGGVETRVGLHAHDRSYVQYYFGGGQHTGSAPNISVEYSASAGGGLELLLTPVQPSGGGGGGGGGGNSSEWEVQLRARYAWLRTGGLQATGGNGTHHRTSIEFSAAGLPPLAVYATAAGAVAGPVPGWPVALTVALDAGHEPVGFSTTATATPATIMATLAKARAAEQALLVQAFGEARVGEGQAIKAAVMWNLHSAPAENGGAPLLPVSRAWGTRGLCPAVPPATSDFTYIIFDWDNMFASLLAAAGAAPAPAPALAPAPAPAPAPAVAPTAPDGFGIAVSNLIQTVKATTAAGFIPNYAAGGMRSLHSEPPVGAKVTLELVKKFGAERMKWVVEVVFDDLLDNNDWFFRKRLKPPLRMIALGTYDDQTQQVGSMQDARYESGLDNSPMCVRPPRTRCCGAIGFVGGLFAWVFWVCGRTLC